MKTPEVVRTNTEPFYLPDNTSLYELVKINFYIHLRDNLQQAENILKLIDDRYNNNKEKYKEEGSKYKQRKRQNDYVFYKWKSYQEERSFFMVKVMVYKKALWKLKSDLYSVEDYKNLPTYINSEWKTDFSMEDKRDYDLWLLINEEEPEEELPTYCSLSN